MPNSNILSGFFQKNQFLPILKLVFTATMYRFFLKKNKLSTLLTFSLKLWDQGNILRMTLICNRLFSEVMLQLFKQKKKTVEKETLKDVHDLVILGIC